MVKEPVAQLALVVISQEILENHHPMLTLTAILSAKMTR